MCKSKFQERKRNIHGVEKDESSDDDLYVGSVGSTQPMTTNEWYEDVKIADKTINVQLDTGAKCNVISIKDLQRLGIKANIRKSEAQLKSYSGHTITTKGVTTLPCEYKRETYQVKFHIVEILAPPELSASTCKEMNGSCRKSTCSCSGVLKIERSSQCRSLQPIKSQPNPRR